MLKKSKKRGGKTKMKKLVKRVLSLDIRQIIILAEALENFADDFAELPIIRRDIDDLQDFLEWNFFEDVEQKEVLKEAAAGDYMYFSFDWSNGWKFYKNSIEFNRNFIDNCFESFMKALKQNVNLLEVGDVLKQLESENSYANYIAFGSAWKKYCQFIPFRKVLRRL